MPHTPPPTGNWLNCSIQHDHSMLPYCTASVYRIFCVRLDILCVLFSCVLAPCKATCVENSHHSWIMQVHVPPSASPARGICRVNLSSQIRTSLYIGSRHERWSPRQSALPLHTHSETPTFQITMRCARASTGAPSPQCSTRLRLSFSRAVPLPYQQRDCPLAGLR